MGDKDMISAKEFADLVGRPYQTIMYWLRNDLVPGVEVVQESRGPVYFVPREAVKQFKGKGPKRGRPLKAKTK